MISIPPEAIRRALLEFLEQFWTLNHEGGIALAKRPMKQKAEEVATEILRTAIKDHPLYEILKYVLYDIVEHANAIDLLGKSQATLLHVRHIEEVYTVSKYLLITSDRYQEFSWRWRNFRTLHAIRNRVLNLKQPLDPMMVQWLEANLENMRTFFSKKFDIDPQKCLSQWERLSNWLQGIALTEVFEKAGRSNSYTSAAYDWNSQAVHLSPLGNVYIGYEIGHLDYGDFALESASTHLHKMCHECFPIVSDQESLRKYYLRQVLLETYRLLCEQPERYANLANKGALYARVTDLLLKKPFDFNEIMNAAIGAPPRDPLLLEFKLG